MQNFNQTNINKLKDFLCNGYSHDAKLKNFNYDCKEDKIKIELFNPIFNVMLNLTFHNIAIVLVTKDAWHGNRETVLSLTVEEDFSFLQNCILKHDANVENSLYLLFQMFSGDEIHIVSKEIFVEEN